MLLDVLLLQMTHEAVAPEVQSVPRPQTHKGRCASQGQGRLEARWVSPCRGEGHSKKKEQHENEITSVNTYRGFALYHNSFKDFIYFH